MDPVFAPVLVPQPTPRGVTQALRPEKGSSNFPSIFPSIFHMIFHLETARNLRNYWKRIRGFSGNNAYNGVWLIADANFNITLRIGPFAHDVWWLYSQQTHLWDAPKTNRWLRPAKQKQDADQIWRSCKWFFGKRVMFFFRLETDPLVIGAAVAASWCTTQAKKHGEKLTSQACSKGCPKPGSRRFSSKKAWANLWWVFLGRFADGLMVVNQLLNCSQLCKCRPSDGWHRNGNMAHSGVKIESGKKNGSVSISEKVIAQEVSPTTFFSMYLTVYAQN